MPFTDRQEAAGLLAERLAPYRGKDPLVLGIPRGGVIMARIIADALGGQVDVALVHKLGAPGQPEVAIGSVDERGRVYLNDPARSGGIDESYIKRETSAQMAELSRRRAAYMPDRTPPDPAGRVVIVVDDGLATGATMIAALRSVRAGRPVRLVAATAVAPAETLEEVAALADEVICLEVPPVFFAVGQFFVDFSQVSDEEVIACLRE